VRDIDEEAVIAVERGLAERFAINRDQALAVLAVPSAINCSAQAPKSEIFFDEDIVTLSRPSRAARPAQPEFARRDFHAAYVGAQERTSPACA